MLDTRRESGAGNISGTVMAVTSGGSEFILVNKVNMLTGQGAKYLGLSTLWSTLELVADG